ncbi:phosphotransferase [Leucobacter sp. NPDC058333]|uniref:phosphotransferase n=1 Tax=Leucobacter sp. NPDC058333 TaxID=3346450 RepID=UPI00365A6CD4
MEREHLPGGSGGVWRVREPSGVTRVHRPTGPWTPAVHALLEHLDGRGLDGIPRVHGIDSDGREILDYLPGETIDPEAASVSDEALGAAAVWLRRFHDAVRQFDPGPVEWRQGVQSLADGQVICHNDPGLYNWVVVDGNFAGMIDWDRAGPGDPLDDLAFLCWSGVPLLREIPAADAARRLEIAVRAYGGVSPDALLDAVDARMALISGRWRAGLERQDPGTMALRDAGIMDRHHARVEGFSRRRAGIREAIRGELRDESRGELRDELRDERLAATNEENAS